MRWEDFTEDFISGKQAKVGVSPRGVDAARGPAWTSWAALPKLPIPLENRGGLAFSCQTSAGSSHKRERNQRAGGESNPRPLASEANALSN